MRAEQNPKWIDLAIRQKFVYWGPALLWMAAIFWFSTDAFSGMRTGSLLVPLLRWLFHGIQQAEIAVIHFLVRKAAHASVYAILALLALRGFRAGVPCRWRWGWSAGSLLVVAACALADEYHQTLTSHRTGSLCDSLIDISGGAAALLLVRASMPFFATSLPRSPALASSPDQHQG